MKLKIADKNAKWWKGEKGITWAIKHGEDWWLFPPEEKKKQKKMSNCVFPLADKNGLTDMIDKFYFVAKCVWAGLLGVSLALNIVLYLQVKELQSNPDSHAPKPITKQR